MLISPAWKIFMTGSMQKGRRRRRGGRQQNPPTWRPWCPHRPEWRKRHRVWLILWHWVLKSEGLKCVLCGYLLAASFQLVLALQLLPLPLHAFPLLSAASVQLLLFRCCGWFPFFRDCLLWLWCALVWASRVGQGGVFFRDRNFLLLPVTRWAILTTPGLLFSSWLLLFRHVMIYTLSLH